MELIAKLYIKINSIRIANEFCSSATSLFNLSFELAARLISADAPVIIVTLFLISHKYYFSIKRNKNIINLIPVKQYPHLSSIIWF